MWISMVCIINAGCIYTLTLFLKQALTRQEEYNYVAPVSHKLAQNKTPIQVKSNKQFTLQVTLLFYDFGITVSNQINWFPANSNVRKRGKARNLASAAGSTIFKRAASSLTHV